MWHSSYWTRGIDEVAIMALTWLLSHRVLGPNPLIFVDTERGVNQYQVQFKNFFNLYLNHSIISNEK
jgi:hypothetical protein